MSENVIDTLRKAGGVQKPKSEPAEPKAKSRADLRGLVTYFPPEVIRQLKIICADQRKNQHQMVGEALNDLFVKYGKKPIVEVKGDR
jgi:hypothetical protein